MNRDGDGDDEHVAVLMIAHEGPIGDIICNEAARSFCEPAQVTGFYLADMHRSGVRKQLMECVPRRLGDRLTHVEVTAAPRTGGAAAAYQKLVKLAERDGYRFVILARSHERLQNHKTKLMYERLPAGWSRADVLQAVTNVAHRPQADVLIRTSLFTFVGTVLAAPLPLSQLIVNQLTVLPMTDCAVLAEEEKRPVSDAVADVGAALMELAAADRAPEGYAEFAKAYLEQQVVCALRTAQLNGEAVARLHTRVTAGPRKGWGGCDGYYFALVNRHVWKPEPTSSAAAAVAATDSIADLVLAANVGLSFSPPRMEGLLALCRALRKADMFHLAGLLLTAGIDAAPATPVSSWLGNPTVLDVGLREEACVATFYMEESVDTAVCAAHMHALCALGTETGKYSSSVQTSYSYVKDFDDVHPARALFPKMSDHCLADLAMYPGIVSSPVKVLEMFGFGGDQHVAAPGSDDEGCAVPITPCLWLLRSIQTVLHLPVFARWECAPHMMMGRVPMVYVGQGTGYMVFISLVHDPVTPTVLHKVKHVRTGHEVTPSDPTEVAALQADGGNRDAWEVTTSVSLPVASLVALRCTQYFRIDAGPASRILFAEVKF